MPKKRIYELSKELNLKNSDIVEFLQSKNVDVKSHSSSIDDDAVDMVKKHFGKGTTVQKTEAPKEIKEQPVKAEAAPKQENNTAQPAKSEQPKQPEQKKPHITAVFNPHNSERRDIRDNRDSRRQDNNGFRRDGNGSRPDGNNRDNNGFRRDGNRDNNGFRREGNGNRTKRNKNNNNLIKSELNRDKKRI